MSARYGKPETMRRLVRALRAAGWRVRNGGWPKTRNAEARWDFFWMDDTLYPRTSEAQLAMSEIFASAITKPETHD